MSHAHIQNASDSKAFALEASAGLALACAYSSSDEYEAELIQTRRKAGAYGSRHHRNVMVAATIAGAAIVAILLAV